MGLRSAKIESKIADKLVVLSSDNGELKLAYKLGRELSAGVPPIPQGIPIASSEALDQSLYLIGQMVYLPLCSVGFDDYFIAEWRFRRLQFQMLKRLGLMSVGEVNRNDVYRYLIRYVGVKDKEVRDFIEKVIREEEWLTLL